jgi:hypothetical protein
VTGWSRKGVRIGKRGMAGKGKEKGGEGREHTLWKRTRIGPEYRMRAATPPRGKRG